jgi:PAS domain S-box-containing protein
MTELDAKIDMPSRSLRRWLIASLVCFNVLVVVLSGYSIHQSRQQHELHAETLTQNVAVALDQSVSANIQRIELALQTVVDELERQLAAGRINDDAMTEFLARHEQRLPEVEAFRVADADGRVILGKGVNRMTGASWADRAYFVHHREQDDRSTQISKPVMGRVAKQYIVGLSRRFNHPDGRFAGVVSGPIAVDSLAPLLGRFDLGKQGLIVLRDADMGLIARLPRIPDKPIGQIGNSTVSPELTKIANSGVRLATYHAPVSADGFTRIATFRRLSGVPMIVIAGTASEDYLAGWINDVITTGGIASCFTLLSVVLGGSLLRRISEAERRGQALAERKEQLRTLMETLPDAIQFKDAQGRWQLANSVCLRRNGLAGSDWTGLTDSEIGLAHPRLAVGLARSKAADDEAWHEARPCRIEEQGRDEQGLLTCRAVIRVPVFDDAGARRAMVVIERDISERKRSEIELAQHRRHLEELVAERTAALTETEARASHIVQSSAAGLFGVDTNGIITFVNPATCDMLGYTAEQMIGVSGHVLFHHKKADGTPYPLDECPSHGALVSGCKLRVDNEVYWHADGHAVPVTYAIHPLVQNGVTTGAVISFVDMGPQRAAALASERALNAAEQLARTRSEFLANMSHEIRTPLNGVLGFAEIGLRHHLNADKAREAFEKIQTSGKRLLGVIEDVLDFSKIEAGKLVIERTEVDLGELIGHAIELVKDRAVAKGLELRVESAADLPKIFIGDPVRLGQVLLNLLSNAVKFTDRGSVVLSVALRGGDLVFTVTDTGIGLSSAQLAELFMPFQQGDSSITRRFGGTGLGLAISKRIVDLMGGRIDVASEPDAGTRVEFRLPYVPALPRRVPDSAHSVAGEGRDEYAALRNASILVLEDDRDTRELLVEAFTVTGARIVAARNGREAIERIRGDGPKAFDLVLMDIQMPGIDGYETTREIHALAPGLPVIAHTAHASSDERARCVAAGMIDHITKPIRPADLLRRVGAHLAAASEACARN